MAGTRTAAPPATLAEVYKAALARKRERRNVYRSYSEAERRAAWLEARELPTVGIYAPEWKPPQTAAEFFDDRLVERYPGLHGLPESPVLYAIADAAREGAAAAVRAVRAARGLDARAQFVAFANLQIWRGHEDAPKTGAQQVVAAVIGEWSRLGLAEAEPDD